MAIIQNLFQHAFGLPRGFVGRLGGRIMGRLNAQCGTWLIDLLRVTPADSVLEVGFGTGVIIQRLSKITRVAGIDISHEMVEQASARNAAAIAQGIVSLHHGSVSHLPFDDDTFDQVLAINSMQVWPDPLEGLEELRRVMKPGAILALGFTRYAHQSRSGLMRMLAAAGFANPQLRESEDCFCALAAKPQEKNRRPALPRRGHNGRSRRRG